MLALCFAPWDFTPLVWVALVPLICAVWLSPSSLRRPGMREAGLGYVAGLVFFSAVFYWLGALGALFRAPLLYGLPLLLAVYMALYFAFWAWFLGRVLAVTSDERRFPNSWRNLATGALGAGAWMVQEWVRGWLLSGFGWNGLGVPLHADLPMIQIASITGVLGLAGIVAFVNLMLVIVVRRIVGELGAQFLKRIRWEFSLSVAAVVFVFAYGVRTLLAPVPEAVALRVTAIQPNIPQTVKFSADGEDEIFRQLGNLTALAAGSTQPQLLIWPESATPRGIYSDDVNFDFVMRHAALGDFGLLLGTVEDDPERGATFNVAKLFTERGKHEQTHRKMHLVPFGEYLPMRRLLGAVLGGLVPGDFDAGHVATVFDLPRPGIRLSALICFEDTLGDLTRDFVRNGAQLLVNVTNDGWFLRTAGAQQHLDNAVFRAVENRRPLIRCTNTGMTCSIDRHGHVDHWLRPFQQGFAARNVNVPKAPELTFYTRHGDWIAHVSTGVILIAMVRRRRK